MPLRGLRGVVGVYDARAYEIEFSTPGGDTVAVLTLAPAEIRPPVRREILHAWAEIGWQLTPPPTGLEAAGTSLPFARTAPHQPAPADNRSLGCC